jgi:carotenoid 1,2-hydratase
MSQANVSNRSGGPNPSPPPSADPHLVGAPEPGGDFPLSAGFAGVDSRLAHEAWAEESRHGLTSPGAYEWWYFHAISPRGDGILLTLFEGLPFHPNYLSQIHRYAHRLASFSKKPWPDLQASRYPAAYMAVYEGGKRVAQFLNLYPPDSVHSQPGVPDIRVGPNRITLRQDGSFGIVVKGYPYVTNAGRPRRQAGQLLTAQLTFAPTFPGIQHTRPFRVPDRHGATHQWVLTAPHGRMTGEVLLTQADSDEPAVELELDTIGYHDHVYGQGGLATGVDTLLWGFIQGENWTAAWHQSLNRVGKNRRADGLIFFEAGHPPIIIDAPDVRLSKPHLSSWLLKHPGRISMHGSDAHGHPLELLLSHATLDSAPFHTRLAAHGTLSIPGRGNGGSFVGQGATHVLKLRRLRWPILSDLTLLAITPIPRDDPIWNA